MTELVLGTAQLGAAYGVTNSHGRLDELAARELVRAAMRRGIRTFDTAVGYGDSEERLGRMVSRSESVRYITKITLDDVTQGIDSLIDSSRTRLQADQVAVLLHRAADLVSPRFPEFFDGLRELRRSGAVSAIGVSVYDREELDTASSIADIDLVQLPGSAADSRLLEDPRVAELAARGIEIHVRSVFLQGLLLADPDQLPSQFEVLRAPLLQLDVEASARGVSRLALLLASVRSVAAVSGVIVGATNVAEIEAIADAWAEDVIAPAALPQLPEEVLDPRRWAV